MKPFPEISRAAHAAVAALVLLGMIGGSLIVAHAGFTTSPKHGGSSTFVPAPEAYVVAGLTYVMSAIGLLVLLRARRASALTMAVVFVSFVVVAVLLARAMAPG